MMIKGTPQGALIYLTMAAFLLAAIAFKSRRQRLGDTIFFIGFLIASVSLAYRGWLSAHTPLQNLFEIFLAMAALLWPLSRLNRQRATVDTRFWDVVLGFVILFPAGFVFSEELRRLPPALQSPLFIPHVASYIAGYLLMARAALVCFPCFSSTLPSSEKRSREWAAFQMAMVGFFLITTGLILGAIWGKLAWGHYWQWDPKEMWSLASWMVYAGYFHYRAAWGTRNSRVLALWLWIGFIFILLTLTWINVSRMFQGMHNYAT
jgi:ABC-type transport system involved in cytochrome c biogenesis permease subunit